MNVGEYIRNLIELSGFTRIQSGFISVFARKTEATVDATKAGFYGHIPDVKGKVIEVVEFGQGRGFIIRIAVHTPRRITYEKSVELKKNIPLKLIRKSVEEVIKEM